MKKNIQIESLPTLSLLEMAERKGTGHPDSICDHLAESVSIALCKYYLQEFGTVLHHNVDKALLIGGSSSPAFGGGQTIEPIEIILSGRATDEADGRIIPVQEIAESAAKAWISKNMRFLDPEKDVKITVKIKKGSNDLTELFRRFGQGEMPLANDTSFGVAFYPFSELETMTLKIERLLNAAKTKELMPFIGEDIKVMAVNCGHIHYTVSIAMVDRFISDLSDYKSKIEQIKLFIRENLNPGAAELFINTADNYENGSVYLTVTGTSAEAGDDGEVGRGNRINGLITPYRPMSLEAVAGKNPISHIGKIYNRFCLLLCKAIVEQGLAEEAHAYIVSQIGKPIDEPQMLHLKLKNCKNEAELEDFAAAKLEKISSIWKKMLVTETPFEMMEPF
jgi:S-adenosylmethionine synthetase